MKRLHVHVSIDDLARSMRFYSMLFAAQPSVTKPDYATRMLQQADQPVLEEGATVCCYAKSEKAWIADPRGVAWETFLTTGESPVCGDDLDLAPIRAAATSGACRTPETLRGACRAPKPELAAGASCCGEGVAA